MTNDRFAHIDPDEHEAKSMAIYREKIRPLVYPQQKGRMLVIDPESGDYEIDASTSVAADRLRKRRPDSLFYGIRIGYKAAISFGGRLLPEEEC